MTSTYYAISHLVYHDLYASIYFSQSRLFNDILKFVISDARVLCVFIWTTTQSGLEMMTTAINIYTN